MLPNPCLLDSACCHLYCEAPDRRCKHLELLRNFTELPLGVCSALHPCINIKAPIGRLFFPALRWHQ